MQDLPVEEIGHRRQADVRMRSHVHAAARREPHRSHVVDEDERPDHLLLHGGQDAADGEPADVALPAAEEVLDARTHRRYSSFGSFRSSE
jgi:hypothetical protein